MVRKWIENLGKEITACEYEKLYPYLHNVYIRVIPGFAAVNDDVDSFEKHATWTPNRLVYYTDLNYPDDMRYEYITEDEFKLLSDAWDIYLKQNK